MSTSEDVFEIKLLVGGTYYPLTIKRKDEAVYRDAAKKINMLLNRYRDHFPQLSDEKYYVMAAMHIAVVNQMMENLNDTKPFNDRIEELSVQLDSLLDGQAE